MSLAPEQDVSLEQGSAEPSADVVPAPQPPDPPAANPAAWDGQRPRRRLARVVAVVAVGGAAMGGAFIVGRSYQSTADQQAAAAYAPAQGVTGAGGGSSNTQI